MAFDEAGQQALAEQLHDCLGIPGREGVKSTVIREGQSGVEGTKRMVYGSSPALTPARPRDILPPYDEGPLLSFP